MRQLQSLEHRRRHPRSSYLLAGALGALLVPGVIAAQCERTITADVVAFDQAIFYNRLGAFDPVGMMYALKRDVVPISGSTLGAGNVKLRADKRPRPLTLRANVGDCLKITFTNLLAPTAKSWQDPSDPERHQHQPATRHASIHIAGLVPQNTASDGSNVGKNASSLVAPGGTITYTYMAGREGTYFLYSTGATTGGEGDGGTLARGLFGAVNVQPRKAEWYRNQLTAQELQWATSSKTPAGQPVINYDAVYPTGHARAGLPILKVLHNGEIIHTDLNAIITGPNKGRFPAGTYPDVKVAGDRHEPYREFTVIFHDETGLVQAFPEFDDPKFEHTLHSGRDAFAINYGTGGIGAEVLANRFGVGPMKDCNDCKYEEFFLSSWAVGDPAMVVDVPANTRDGSGNLIKGAKATKVLYPDDPSNVHHSYLNDRVKIRNLHAGPKEHHIFHLHAHQWLHTPDGDNSTYLDSQAIGPGAGFTYEMTYGGSGNRNKTPGDAIFHCHFYPHFAQGMWELWRVHDVYETGTVLDAEGKPAAGARALPDGEIAAGTPIPAVVPMPGKALPVMPTSTFAGYPFYIPGVAGHRPPKPPMDTPFDGGLPRHVVKGGVATFPALNRFDFSKHDETLDAVQLPENGTAAEQAAINFHATRNQPSYKFDGAGNVATANFITNGLPAIGGAPFADPCVDDAGNKTGAARVYKSASFQMDVKYNKAGWHFPQHRMFALWEDVKSTLAGTRAPEPLFFRARTGECVTYHLVNLIPAEYKLDDFQVRTPTDVIGQHIHLVKFDVTSSDGSANGFNYEDGALAPAEVVARVAAIRKFNGCTGVNSGDSRDGSFTCPVAKAHPFFGAGANNEWVGAQENIQRWFVDDVKNMRGEDRTLRTVFTHDHFGPSTHQQGGLYAGLVTEKAGTEWRHPETGVTFGTRTTDGGPTSWRADVLFPATPDSSFREFNVQIADFSLAYKAGSKHAGDNWADPANAINPPGKFEVGLPFLLRPPIARNLCPNEVDPPPCPELISADDPGTMLVNYRNEPLALRVRDPGANAQAAGLAGDLSHAFRSNITRADGALNTQPTFYPALTGGVNALDPFTPLMRAFEGDKVQIRILVGAHEEGHNFSVHGMRWLFEPSDPNSGNRNSQMMGISEHYEFVVPQLPHNFQRSYMDYLYEAGSASDDLWNGMWGLFRAYRRSQRDILKLPNNNSEADITPANLQDFNGSVCHRSAPIRRFDISAVLAANALPGGVLTYNSRTGFAGPIHDPGAIMYVRSADLDANGKLKPRVPVEPLILRANAGDCLEVTLRNKLPATLNDADGFNTLPMIVDQFNNNQINPSSHVGLHPQLLEVDVSRHNGVNVGNNNLSTAVPGDTVFYRWYAGALTLRNDSLIATPVEFGATNLISSDRVKHSNKGAIGALIIEPQNATWSEDGHSRASANVSMPLTCLVTGPGNNCGNETYIQPYYTGGPYGGFQGSSGTGTRQADVRVDYFPAVKAVTVTALTPDYPNSYIAAYDAAGNLLTYGYFASDGDPNKYNESTIRLTAPGIAIVILHPDPKDYVAWDRMRWEGVNEVREAVALFQDDLNLRNNNGAIRNTADAEDAEDSGQKGLNYRTEPFWHRMGYAPDTPLEQTEKLDFKNVLSNAQVGGDPQTPVFTYEHGFPFRMRVLQPAGHARSHVLNLHGHVWDELPYAANSTVLSPNPISEWKGMQHGHGPTNHFDVLPRNSGGLGDYLLRDQVSFQLDGGLWGLVRVVKPCFIYYGPNDTQCGINTNINPFVTGGPFGGFQSTTGTGAQSPITITFSAAVSSVTVTALDPDFVGNHMIAYDASGNEVGRVSFDGDNYAGVYTESRKTITGKGIVKVLLVPDPNDYVAWDHVKFIL